MTMTQHIPSPRASVSNWSESELLERMLRRDANGWREFHRRYDRLIFRCIHKVTARFSSSLTNEDVREIYGMFLLSLNQRGMYKLRAFEPERGNKLSTWVGMLATNCAWDYLRRVARQPPSTSLADAEDIRCDSTDPYEELLKKERWTAIARAVSGFSEKDRAFVRLYYVDGLTPEQVAERMSISVKTVYSKKHKIRCRLQKALGPQPEEQAVA